MDSIAFYTDQELADWMKRFNDSPADVIIISDIPFSYYEIRDELLRRERCED